MTLLIKKLLKISKEVLKNCALENGAIVAANTDHPFYPRLAANYRFVWPRDASYVCVAADYLNLKIQEPFFKWMAERPEDLKKEGLIYQKYATNGRLEIRNFQPDQAGTLLWAIHHYFQKNLTLALQFENLIRTLADGLVNDWRGSYFFHNTVDLWEEGHRQTSTHYANNFTYSLAACSKGLELANNIIKNSRWLEVSCQMKERIELAYDMKKKYFLRNYGKISDFNVDASLLGLVWPFEIIKAKDKRMVNTIKKMEKEIVIAGGVHRYQFDYYDGEGSGQEGAGAWPLLNFWLSIYFTKAGHKEKAKKYYNWVIKKTKKYHYHIPEQIFTDERQGIYPLAWSHAMFVIASKFLGYL